MEAAASARERYTIPPQTMPFPADPGKDSRFIGRAGMELVHAKDGNSPLLTLRPLNRRKWDDTSRARAVTPCRQKDSCGVL